MRLAAALVLIVGVAVLLHATYAAYLYRSFLRITEEQFNSLPIGIIIECFVGFIIASTGGVLSLRPYVDTRLVATVPASWDIVNARASFAAATHRGHVMFKS